jgi:hypothetical protein
MQLNLNFYIFFELLLSNNNLLMNSKIQNLIYKDIGIGIFELFLITAP